MSVELSKYSGSGNATLKASSLNDIHTGRKDKTTTFKGLTSKGALAKVKVVEKASDVIFYIDDPYPIVSNKGGYIHITGITNQLGIHLYADFTKIGHLYDPIIVTDLKTGEVSSLSWGEAEPDHFGSDPYDIGKFGEERYYKFDITIPYLIPNNTISVQYDYIYIRPICQDDYWGENYEIEIEIEQQASSAYIYVNTNGTSETTSAEAIMTQEGTPLNFYIMSNTQWQITNE